MNFSIQEVDQVIERTGCSYEEAKEALMNADGNVIDALIYLEKKKKSGSRFFGLFEDGERNPDSIMKQIKNAIDQGNVDKIVLRDKDGDTITSVSVNAGAALGTFTLLAGAAPLAVIAGLIAKFGMNCQFVIVRSDGSETVL